MPVRKFESQEHLVPAVMDSRVLDFPRLFQVDDRPVFEYSELALELGYNHRPRRAEGYVNGLTQLGSKGRDGEDASGFLELVQIDTPEGNRRAAIQSWMFAHKNGMPYDGTSWFCEFEDVNQALDFWSWWRGSFRIDDIAEALQDRDLSPDTYNLQRLGLLKPWYQQKPEDRVFLEKFSSSGTEIVKADRLTRCADFLVAQVYKVSEGIDWSQRPKQEIYRLETCLGAFTTRALTGGWYEGTSEVTAVFVQWASGHTGLYREGREQLPEPVEAREFIPKAKPHSVTA